jgi:ubiquinone/menaquinone biosynthesis C-methylase UbiE
MTVTDISSGMLTVAQRVLGPTQDGGPALSFVEADLAALPVPGDAFDLVLSQLTPLLESPAGLSEVARALRVGGRLAAATWGSGYGELDLLDAARAEAGIDPYPEPDQVARAARMRDAGFDSVMQRTVDIDVQHGSAEAYLAYRAGFGIPFVADEAKVAAYQDALRRRVEALVSMDGHVRLDWTIVIVTARLA